MRRRVASRVLLSLSLLALLRCARGGADPVPSWHPHRAKHREYAEGSGTTAAASPGAVTAGNESAPAPGAASQPAAAAGFASTLGCGVLASPEWERRVCFGPLAVAGGAGAAGLPLATLNITVSLRPAGGSASAAWEPACGAALRLVLASQRALLAPDAPLRESECGVHPLRVTLPRDAPAYTAQLRLLHAETSASDAAGAEPALLNARVAVAGALTLPPDAWDDPEEATAVGEAHAGGGDFWSLNTAQLPRFAEGVTRAPVARDAACTGGDARGRWQFSHSLYSLELGEPLAWRPHGCHYRYSHGHLAGQCARGWTRPGGGGAWLFAGGSQLAQLAAAIRVVVANETYFWTRLAVPDVDGNNVEAEALATRVLHTRLRLDTAADARAAGVEALPVPPPNDDDAAADKTPNAWVLGKHAWVLGLGAADAEIGTPVHAFADDVAGWLQALRDAVDAKKLPSPRRVIWVTAAAAAYKPGAGFAGGVSCAPGAPSCSATRPGSHYAAAGPGGGFAFAAAPLPRSALGGAAQRRAPAVRALNAAAVKAVRAAFPEALIVDYEAMTEALPADYSVDGTHWGCDDEDAKQAAMAGGPFRCRSLANTAAGNALMHTLCDGFVSEFQSRLLRFSPDALTPAALVAAADKATGGARCPHGAAWNLTTIGDPLRGDRTCEARFALYPVQEEDRLPSPLALFWVVVGPLPNSHTAMERAVDTLVSSMQAVHAAVGAPNPFALNHIDKRDCSFAANTSPCCSAPLFNGPHIDPAVRALVWDCERGVPKSPPPRTPQAHRRRHR